MIEQSGNGLDRFQSQKHGVLRCKVSQSLLLVAHRFSRNKHVLINKIKQYICIVKNIKGWATTLKQIFKEYMLVCGVESCLLFSFFNWLISRTCKTRISNLSTSVRVIWSSKFPNRDRDNFEPIIVMPGQPGWRPEASFAWVQLTCLWMAPPIMFLVLHIHCAETHRITS